MNRRSLRTWLCTALVSGATLLPTPGEASATAELRYTRTQIFSGALRYLRIDLGYEITEKDADAAYLMFRYVPHGMQEPTFGAIEIVQVKQGVKLAVKLPKLPSYHEAVIRDGLLQKLKADYGGEPGPKTPAKDEAPGKDKPRKERPKDPESKEKPSGDEDNG
jgi:hypothetical protein